MAKEEKIIRWFKEGQPIPSDAKFIRKEERTAPGSIGETIIVIGYLYEVPLDKVDN